LPTGQATVVLGGTLSLARNVEQAIVHEEREDSWRGERHLTARTALHPYR